MASPAQLAAEAEQPDLPAGTEDRFADYAIMGLPFSSGHVLAMRRFPASSHEFTAEAVERDFGASADGAEPGEDHVVFLDGDPIGLIQYSRFGDYPEDLEELAPILAVDPDAVTIDYMIGEPSMVGQSHGTGMLRAFVERIWQTNATAPYILVPVNSANEASWKALLAVDFHLEIRGELEPDNPIDERIHEILRLDRPSP